MVNIAYDGDTEATFVNQFYDNKNDSINNGFTHKYHSAI
jgi:predicted GNAT superfamily acetyltransferase